MAQNPIISRCLSLLRSGASELVKVRQRSRKSGHTLSTVDLLEDRVLLALTGDTRPTLIARVPELRQAQFVLHETTFLDERGSPQEARLKGHTHLQELTEQLSDLSGTFLPYHISQMYTAAGARRTLRQKLSGAQWARTLPLLPGAR